MTKSYFDMIDAVNDATTEREHAYAEARLSGWIECAEYHKLHWSGISADQYTAHKYGDRPMCCGVLLDWTPNAGMTPTLCWACNTVYPIVDMQCPSCGATNANRDPETAAIEVRAKTFDRGGQRNENNEGDPL